MNLVFEKLTRSLAANQLWRTGIAANFFRISEAAYPVTVRLYKDNRELGTMSNLLAGDYVRDVEFDAVQVENGATAQSVTVQIAGGGVGSDRVLGEVSVISGEVSRAEAGLSFWGGSSIGASAGQFAHVQLWNPAASGVNLIMTELLLSSENAGSLALKRSVAALATLVYNVPSKKSTGAASVAQVRTQSLGAVTGDAHHTEFVIAANTTVSLKMSEPLVITEGRGIVAIHQTVTSVMRPSFQFYEKPI